MCVVNVWSQTLYHTSENIYTDHKIWNYIGPCSQFLQYFSFLNCKLLCSLNLVYGSSETQRGHLQHCFTNFRSNHSRNIQYMYVLRNINIGRVGEVPGKEAVYLVFKSTVISVIMQRPNFYRKYATPIFDSRFLLILSQEMPG